MSVISSTSSSVPENWILPTKSGPGYQMLTQHHLARNQDPRCYRNVIYKCNKKPLCHLNTSFLNLMSHHRNEDLRMHKIVAKERNLLICCPAPSNSERCSFQITKIQEQTNPPSSFWQYSCFVIFIFLVAMCCIPCIDPCHILICCYDTPAPP